MTRVPVDITLWQTTTSEWRVNVVVKSISASHEEFGTGLPGISNTLVGHTQQRRARLKRRLCTGRRQPRHKVNIPIFGVLTSLLGPKFVSGMSNTRWPPLMTVKAMSTNLVTSRPRHCKHRM